MKNYVVRQTKKIDYFSGNQTYHEQFFLERGIFIGKLVFGKNLQTKYNSSKIFRLPWMRSPKDEANCKHNDGVYDLVGPNRNAQRAK